MDTAHRTLSGWGRYPRVPCPVQSPEDEADLIAAVAQGPVIARGLGRAYGDSALAGSAAGARLIDMRRLNRILAFDPAAGHIVCEAGAVLGDVIEAVLPHGWLPAVMPGTKYVTVGGMVAADVHGKNHHRDGAFRACIDWIDILGPEGTVRRCGPSQNPALFDWTCGGMGLTGLIVRVAFRLAAVPSGWLRQTTIAATTLQDALDLLEAHADAPYAVAWIDCLAGAGAMGRSLITLAEHAPAQALAPRCRAAPFHVPRRRALTVPFDAPGFVLSGPAMRAFNTLYYALGRHRAGTALVDWDRFFFPLDGLRHWNRMYGRRGLVQFQCILPPEGAHSGLTRMIEATSARSMGSFLAVLKRMGGQGGGIAFPREGYTLALDFPVSPGSLALLEDLDRIALDHGGCFYLAKDARMSRMTFARAEPRAAAFRAFRAQSGALDAFASAQSERLGL